MRALDSTEKSVLTLQQVIAYSLWPYSRTGRLLRGGQASYEGGSDFALLRFNMDGILDSTFGVGGKVTTDFFGSADHVVKVAIQPDGKIVALGVASNFEAHHDFAL